MRPTISELRCVGPARKRSRRPRSISSMTPMPDQPLAISAVITMMPGAR
jgi:hypothetical protein